MSAAQTTSVKLKLEIPNHDVVHITEGMRGPNSASPAIDVYDGVQFIQKWAALSPTSRTWLDTPAGIVITHCPEGEYAPKMQLWPALPDGLLAVGDCPIEPTAVTIYERQCSDEDALRALSHLFAVSSRTPGMTAEALLEAAADTVARTGRAA